ncbi:hypothetical protein FOZ62_004910 [Perkinsus olseni]|nr:hypothetical protein FOZ62_004910 [Perkinsus olseni]
MALQGAVTASARSYASRLFIRLELPSKCLSRPRLGRPADQKESAGLHIEADAESCRIIYPDSSVYLHVSSEVQLVRWDARGPQHMSATFGTLRNQTMNVRFTNGNRGRSDEGPVKDILKRYASFFPFARLKGPIKQAFKDGMGREACSDLAAKIEATPPEGYENSTDWVKEFFLMKIDEALKVAKRHTKVRKV